MAPSSTFAYKMEARRGILGRVAPKIAMVVLGMVGAMIAFERLSDHAEEGRPARRRLYQYPEGVCDGYIETHYFWIVVAMLSWGIFYMFWALAIICDDYFVASLEEISEQLSLSPDVAGATFMAAGSSAPELFTSLMGVFAVKNDVGMGTIVGSAVFNLCCIIGGTAMFTPTVLTIDWKPITRDTTFYAIAIVAMIYVVADGNVTTFEASMLMLFYSSYVLFMYFNPMVMEAIEKCEGKSGMAKVEPEGEKSEEEEEEGGIITTAIALPLTSIFTLTVPNCTEEGKKSLYMVTFFVSVLWIGILSYFMVAWASKLGCMFGIHPAVMGCTILAAGTSVPDAIGSLIVAREGQGDMAVSNAIGSNVFDILLGLGLPWTLGGLILHQSTQVDAENLVPLSFILVGTLIGVYFSTMLNGWRLSKWLGAVFFGLYFVFVGYSLAHEFDLIDF